MEKKTLNDSKLKDFKEDEKLAILIETDKVKGEQLVIAIEGLKTESEIKKFALKMVDDPEKKYEMYYLGINRLLLKFLPKGLKNKKARNYIYEEKNTFLTRGKRISLQGRRGGDSRMGYIEDVQELLDLLINWVSENGTMAELYTKLRNLNIEKGYGTAL